jgi:hypothetical protein
VKEDGLSLTLSAAEGDLDGSGVCSALNLRLSLLPLEDVLPKTAVDFLLAALRSPCDVLARARTALVPVDGSAEGPLFTGAFEAVDVVVCSRMVGTAVEDCRSMARGTISRRLS